MIQAATGMIIAYLITFFLLPFIIRIAHTNKLYDKPDERKTHNYPISSLGGIAIFAGLMLSMLLVYDFKTFGSDFQFYLAAFFVIFIIGVIDDIFILKAWKKVVGQVATILLLTFKAHLQITSLQGFLGIGELSQFQSFCLTFFCLMLIINAFNLVDGVDGLAASLGMLACAIFGLFFIGNGQIPYGILAFSISGSLLAFLIYNFPPAKIFMGDSGSTLIGLITAVLAIRFVETASAGKFISVQCPPAAAFGILLLPLMDVLRVITLRLIKMKSPFTPDRNHLHHLLQNKGFTHTTVTLSLLTASVIFASTGIILQNANIHLIVAIQFTLFFSGVYFFKKYYPERSRLHIVKQDDAAEDDAKVYPIFSNKEKISAGQE